MAFYTNQLLLTILTFFNNEVEDLLTLQRQCKLLLVAGLSGGGVGVGDGKSEGDCDAESEVKYCKHDKIVLYKFKNKLVF